MCLCQEHDNSLLKFKRSVKLRFEQPRYSVLGRFELELMASRAIFFPYLKRLEVADAVYVCLP